MLNDRLSVQMAPLALVNYVAYDLLHKDPRPPAGTEGEEAPTDKNCVVALDIGTDNSNLVIGQVIQRRWEPKCVVVRVQDPARADFFAQRGLRTVCPTQTTAATMLDAVRACDAAVSAAGV